MQKGLLLLNVPRAIEYDFVSKGYWKDETLVDYFRRNVKKSPDKEVLVDTRGKRLTNAEISKLVTKLALQFHEMGIGRGDAIAHQLTNCAEAYITMLAAYSVEAFLCPVVPVYRGKAAVEMLNVVKPKAIIVHDSFGGYEYAKAYGSSKGELPSIEYIFVEGTNVPKGMISLNNILESDIDNKYPKDFLENEYHPRGWNVEKVAFTAGTTALPKGSIQRFDNQMYNIRKYIEALKITEDDITLGMTPITHQWCWLYAFGIPIMTNSKVVYIDRWDIKTACQVIEKEKVTYFAGMTTFMVDLTEYYEENKGKYDLSSLRVGHVAGQKLVPRRMVRIAREIGFKTLYGVWGQTENTAPVTHAAFPPSMDSEDLLCEKAGKPWPEMEACIKDVDTGKVLPPGEIGELCLKGPAICMGYFGNPEATAKTWDKEGWFHSTDLFTQDRDGWLVFEGRAIEMIRRGAENIYLSGIERTLDVWAGEHPQIKEATIVAVEDERLGERGCLCLIPRKEELLDKINAIELLKEANDYLLKAGYLKFQLPEYVHLYKDYPRSAMQRIKKLDMSKELSELKRQGKLKGVV